MTGEGGTKFVVRLGPPLVISGVCSRSPQGVERGVSAYRR